MRGLLYALAGFGLACAIGALLIGAPSPMAEIAPIDGAELPGQSGSGAWWIVVLCWMTLLVRRPRWLATSLTIAVMVIGSCAIALGVAGEFWSHATASPEASGKSLLAGGVMILLAPVVGLLRPRPHE